MSNTNFYALKISQIKAETADAVSLSFEIPSDLKSIFDYKAGQYLTLKFNIKGKEERRAYSLCTSAAVDAVPAVTVKKVNRGVVSNHIHTLKVGDMVDVMPPQGRFVADVNADHKKDYFLIGAGSGITPLMSILKSVLEVEPKSRVCLLYGNRNEDQIIFNEELERLEKRYAGQLVVEHILSQPKTEKSGGLMGMFKKGKMSWTGKTGRIDSKAIAKFIEDNQVGDGRISEYFLCGPSAMMKSAEELLQKRGIGHSYIHAEWFTNANEGKAAAASKGGGVASVATVTLNGKTQTFNLAGSENMLTELRKQGIDPPYSCMAGACATCMAKVTKGSVVMENCFALDDDEVAKGFCLTCQAKPSSEEIEFTFDV